MANSFVPLSFVIEHSSVHLLRFNKHKSAKLCHPFLSRYEISLYRKEFQQVMSFLTSTIYIAHRTNKSRNWSISVNVLAGVTWCRCETIQPICMNYTKRVQNVLPHLQWMFGCASRSVWLSNKTPALCCMQCL